MRRASRPANNAAASCAFSTMRPLSNSSPSRTARALPDRYVVIVAPSFADLVRLRLTQRRRGPAAPFRSLLGNDGNWRDQFNLVALADVAIDQFAGESFAGSVRGDAIVSAAPGCDDCVFGHWLSSVLMIG